MMPLSVRKKIQQTALVTALICSLPLAQAWVTPVDMDADNEGSDVKNTVTTIALGGVDRCDTSLVYYALGSEPTQCHRRNLVWQLGSKDDGNVAQPLAQWNPELGNDANWRLPTIKELSRLVDYSNVTGTDGAFMGQPLILNMFPTEAAGFSPSNAWLISSTYRDIDGDPANGQAQIFGINMGTGEIAAFDTENVDDGAGGTTTALKKCDSLNEDGTCNLSDADVYALLVHINTVSELITP